MRYTDQRKQEVADKKARADRRNKKVEPLTEAERTADCIPVWLPHERATCYPKVSKVLANKARYIARLGLRTYAELEAYIAKYRQPGK